MCNITGISHDNPFYDRCNNLQIPSVPIGQSISSLIAGTTCDTSNNGPFFEPFALMSNRPNDPANPFLFIDSFVATAMTDRAGAQSRNPVTGEGRNSLGMDKYKFRGNSYTSSGGFPQHAFEHQSDMPSQENRDFFDQRIINGR